MTRRSLGAVLGVSDAVALFLFSLSTSIPASYAHRLVPTALGRHLYAFASGAFLTWLAYGGSNAVLQIMVPIVGAYAAMLLLRRYCGYLVFAASFAYLAHCHVANLSGDTWRKGNMDFTGTLMIVTLKVTSVALDYQDARLLPPAPASGKAAQPPSTVKALPGVAEYLGFLFCCGSILVGPVFDFASYRDFTRKTGVWAAQEGGGTASPKPLLPALKRVAQAVCCALMYQKLSAAFPASILIAANVERRSLLERWALIWVVAFTFRWMYYFVWLMAEAAMIMSGLAFTGWTTEGAPHGTPQPRWDRGRNANIAGVELGTSAAQLPASWNMSVANWLRVYVYERLRPRSGRAGFWPLALTQLVSALWHGLYPGYYLFFLNCAIAQHGSKALYKLHKSIPEKARLQRGLSTALQYLFSHMVLNYSELGFILLKADQTFQVWRSVLYAGTLIPILISVATSVYSTQYGPRWKQKQ